MTIAPLRGEIRVPGDKSISHRAILLSALARGPSVLTEVNLGRDVLATCRAVAALGVRCRVDKPNRRVEVEGTGWDGLREPVSVLHAGNSGTTLRMMLGVCAPLPFGAALTGDRTLRKRPMGRVVAPLRAMGANIDGRGGGERAPLWVRGAALRGVAWSSEVASAQVKSALLLAGLRARGETSVAEPAESRDHTERMLAAAGVRLTRSERSVALEGGQELEAVDRRIPGDISSAAFLVVAAALLEGSDLTISDVGLNPTRTGALAALQMMGADVTSEATGGDGGEASGRVRVRASRLEAVELSGPLIPTLVDEIPALAVAATQASGTTVIRDARELRVKESDRIEAMAAGLAELGADIETRPDGLVVRGGTRLRGGVVDARGDHRVALSFAVAALVSGQDIRIRGWDSVKTSFPEWDSVVAAARSDA